MAYIRVGVEAVELLHDDGKTVVLSKEKTIEEFLDSGFINVEMRYHNPFYRIMVIERPPATNSIAGGQGLYDIPVPWQVYVVDYATGIVRTYFRKEQLKSLDDELFLCYMDHTKPDGSTCVDGNHRRNVQDHLLKEAAKGSIKGVLDLINDSVWGGHVRGASYMKWYAGIPPEIKKEDVWDNVSKTLDAKFTVERVMKEVTLLSYGGEFEVRNHGGWDEWFGEPLTVNSAVQLIRQKRPNSIKQLFDNHV